MASNGIISSGNGTNSILIQWQSSAGTGSAKVVETNNNGCRGDTVSKSVSVTTGIDELNSSLNVLVYPNPNNGLISIEFKNQNGNKNMQVFDITGKLIQEFQTEKDNLQISLVSMAKGIYLLKIFSEKSVSNFKIILE